jgi:sugar lactone lactonase YvrE
MIFTKTQLHMHVLGGVPERRTGRRVLAVAAATVAVTAVAVPPAQAHGGRPSGPDIRVVATGLDNPRGIVLGEDGALYVAEAGRGAVDPATASCVDTTDPESGESVTNCFGRTGAVTRLSNGHQRRVVTGLPSVAGTDGTGAGGVTSVAVGEHGQLAGIVNCGCDPRNVGANQPAAAIRYAGHVLWMDAKHDRFSVGANVTAFELNNPDAGDPGSEFDSNPYALTWGRHGDLLVADAGGNDLLSVSKRGHISPVALFHAKLVDAPPFLGLPPGTQIPMQAVPNSITRGPDGAYYVGQLTGFPFPVGAANVYRIVPGHRPTVFASGFTNIIGVTFDHKGRLVVLEIATDSLLAENSPGALWVVDRHGHKTLVARDGLVTPGGVAVGRDGRAYVTNFGIFPGQGQVLSIRLP